MTRRQRQVLELVADGETDAEIARTLGIRESTARMHISKLRNCILSQNPVLKHGRPRPVILRYFRLMQSVVSE